MTETYSSSLAIEATRPITLGQHPTIRSAQHMRPLNVFSVKDPGDPLDKLSHRRGGEGIRRRNDQSVLLR